MKDIHKFRDAAVGAHALGQTMIAYLGLDEAVDAYGLYHTVNVAYEVGVKALEFGDITYDGTVKI